MEESAMTARRVAVLAVGIGLVLSSCGEGTESPGDAQGNRELTVAVDTIGPGEWGPARTGDQMQEVSKHLFSTLTRLDSGTGKFVGLLAESFSMSEDGRTWTFTLREDVPFHGDWGTVTAEDVRYSWEAWISEDSNHDLGPTLSQAVDGDMNNFKIVNDLEFTVTTSKPVVTLDSIVSDFGNGLQVVPKRYYEEKGAEADAHPIGTGPWEFVSYTLGVEVVYEAVEDHFYRSPAFDRLVLKEVPDSAARLTQLQSGAVDMALLDSGLVGEATAAGLEIRTIPDVGNVFVILGGSYWGTEQLDRDAPWIQADSPDKGKAVREAMSLAIDRELILDKVLRGQGAEATGPVIQSDAIPALKDPDAEPPEYDVDRAKQKLAEGGYPDGFEITLFMYPDYIDLPAIGEAIAGMWEEIGITVKRTPGEEGTLDAKLDKSDTDGWAWVKIAGLKADPSTQLNGYQSSREDDHKFFHPSIDENYSKMIVEPDVDKRFQMARDVIASLRDDYITLTLFTADLPFIVGPEVGDWEPIPGLDEMTGLETVTPKDAQ
jgi:peptide/nickel transport system substrate-binding protein